MGTIQEDLLKRVFGDQTPPLVQQLLSPSWEPRNFDGGPIFSSTMHHRFYIANRESTPSWDDCVCEAAPAATSLLSNAPQTVRRMVDTDGMRIDVYLDDLHLHGETNIVCHTIEHPNGNRSTLRFLPKLPNKWRHLAPIWGVGRLLERVGDRESLLWMTEARFSRRVQEVDHLAGQLFDVPSPYWHLRRTVPGVYIDAIELHPNGTVDLTPGFR